MNVSHSELACYQSCPRKWHLRYRMRRSGLVSADRLARGKRIHHVLTAIWTWSEGRIAAIDALPPIERAMGHGYWTYHAQNTKGGLRNVTDNYRFDVELLPGVHLVGEMDALGEDEQGPVVVEHKTTTSDISPGSSYWRRVMHCDRQVAIYSMAFSRVRVLYDVLRVPEFEQHKATPVELRKYTQPKYEKCLPCRGKGSYNGGAVPCSACMSLGKVQVEPSRLYANQREVDETPQELYARCLEAMVEAPWKYFQRAWVVRTEQELDEAKRDILQLIIRMQNDLYLPEHERNPESCHSFGYECEFFEVCWHGRDPMTMPEWNDPSFECQRGK